MSTTRHGSPGAFAVCLLLSAVLPVQATETAPTNPDFPRLESEAVAEMTTTEGAAYAKRQSAAFEAAIESADNQCYARLAAGESTSLAFIVRIDVDGVPRAFVPESQTAFAKCFALEFLSNTFGKPPNKQPFHMYFNLHVGP